MRILKLSSNQASFKTVEFNPTGLTIIEAIEKNPEKKNLGDTYNGVGKTLLLNLVSFCLASNKIDAFERKLAGWSFTLEFESKGKTHSVTRHTTNQGKVTLDGKEIPVSKYRG